MEAEKSIVFAVKGFSNQIKRSMDGTLTGMQYGIIKYIDKYQGSKDIFQKDIEAEFNIRRSTATGILQLMVQKGLITREVVSYDARLKKLVTTHLAHELMQDFLKKFEDLENQIIQGISKEEIVIFLEIINKMNQNLEVEA